MYWTLFYIFNKQRSFNLHSETNKALKSVGIAQNWHPLPRRAPLCINLETFTLPQTRGFSHYAAHSIYQTSSHILHQRRVLYCGEDARINQNNHHNPITGHACIGDIGAC